VAERFTRPVSARQLFAAPEMLLRYPDEIEVRREGTDEGEGRGFDGIDLSAAAARTLAAPDDAATVVSWFVEQLVSLGWTDQRDGSAGRDEGESFFARVARNRGTSSIASRLPAHDREIQEGFENSFYQGAPSGWSVVTLIYTVAPSVGRA